MATNPYLQQNADSIATNLTTNLNRNILPQFRRGAVASGGWGNSAGGIAQGIAAGDTSRAIADAQGNMYLGAYEGDQNRSTQSSIANMQAQTQRDIAAMQDSTNRYGLGNQFTLGLGGLMNNAFSNDTSRIGTVGGLDNQRYGMDQSYNLGLGGLANQATGMNQQFYSQQRGQDLQAQQQAQNQYLQALQAQFGLGSAQTAIGDQQYNSYLNPLQAFGSGLSPFTGLNSSQSTTQPQTGGGLAGAAGGAITAAQLAQLWQQLMGGGG